MLMCVKLNSLFYREMKAYYVIQMFKQDINMNTMWYLTTYIVLEFTNTNMRLLQVYLGEREGEEDVGA